MNDYKITIKTYDTTLSPGLFGRPTTKHLLVINASNATDAVKEATKDVKEYILLDIEKI